MKPKMIDVLKSGDTDKLKLLKIENYLRTKGLAIISNLPLEQKLGALEFYSELFKLFDDEQ